MDDVGDSYGDKLHTQPCFGRLKHVSATYILSPILLYEQSLFFFLAAVLLAALHFLTFVLGAHCRAVSRIGLLCH